MKDRNRLKKPKRVTIMSPNKEWDDMDQGGLRKCNIDRYIQLLNEKKVVVSLIASAIRSSEWKRLYYSIRSSNKINFEMIFVGPNPPLEEMPDNFRYIRSNVKPSQCFEIAARESTGKYIMGLGDDCYYASGCIDMMVAYMEKLFFNPYICVTPLWGSVSNFNVDQFVILRDTLYCPLTGGCSMIRASAWREVGGVDKNFVGALFDVDLMYRLYAKGGSCFLANGCFLAEDRVNMKSFLWKMTSKLDVPLLKSLWDHDGVFTSKRSKAVESFSDDNILTESQGISLPKWD